MRITFVCPHVRIAGGVRAILTYADRLARRGHQVVVVVPVRNFIKAWWKNLRAESPDWVGDFRPGMLWVPELSGETLPSADVVVATAWQTAGLAESAPGRCGQKFYLVQHYESLYHGGSEQVDRTYAYPLRKIVISTWLKGIMREKFGADAELLVTPVDPALFSRVEVEPDAGVLRVLMLHHDYAWKGVVDGLEAVRRVKTKYRDLRLVGFGLKRPRRGEAYDEYHENLPQRQLAWLYSRCPIYLCPSWDEGLGMPAMEAMACGAALVTYDNGGCRDYAWDGRTALVARRRDVADLAEKLELAAADPRLRAKISQEGMALITQKFDWELAVTRLEALLSET
ncbi:MAG: glycosyltransferase family 4 protein, partial [Acidimicrobiia bacterium]